MFRNSVLLLTSVASVLLLHACGTKSPSDSDISDFRLNQTASGLPLKTLSLTFDDGPGPRTLELANYLAAQGISATFFMQGSRAANDIATIRKVAELGHLVANHTYNHDAMSRTNDPVSEVTETDDLIAPFVPGKSYLFRAPYGDWASRVANILNDNGLRKYVGPVFWDIGGAIANGYAADWDCWGRNWSVTQCGDSYLKEALDKKRGIVLMHDIHGRTVDMVKYLVPKLKQNGFSFVRNDMVPNFKSQIEALGGKPGLKYGSTPPVDTCREPDASIFSREGRVLTLTHGNGQFQAKAVVDTASLRKTDDQGELPYKLFIQHSSSDKSNMALRVSADGTKLTGFRYNISWNTSLQVPVELTWQCSAWKGTFNYGSKIEDVILAP
jgi:peptidoglycan/xylan/chitin deacetylase (PgdA/CDA1 family)